MTMSHSSSRAPAPDPCGAQLMRDKQEVEQKYEQLRHEMAEVRLIGLPSRLATTN